MNRPRSLWLAAAWVVGLALGIAVDAGAADRPQVRRTTVSIVRDKFYINGEATYRGRTWNGHSIEGRLMNSRMVQGIFDDLNPETVGRWAYPDTGRWDAERNTREFVAAMDAWRRHGLLCFTLNLQGGSPQGYSRAQPWHNSAFEPDGTLRPAYLSRLERILDRADQLGMVAILGYFYFGQDERLTDEAAVVRAVDNATAWVLDRGYRNVLVEVNNEANVRYDHEILKPDRVHELIQRVRDTHRQGRRLLAGTSYGGGTLPKPNVAGASDFILLHGNGVSDPARIASMVRETRAVSGYRGQPILFNEDDHFDFEKPMNNFIAAVSEGASWGYFDYRMTNEPFAEGYQSVPVDWGIGSARKRGFFDLLARMTASDPSQPILPAAARTRRSIVPKLQVRRETYRGWKDAWILDNGEAEVVVVPSIGRIMQFRFKGEDGPLWENRELEGRDPDPNRSDWQNFGGDKAWPAPQADWPGIAGRAWPPPRAFDSAPVRSRLLNEQLVLTTPVDPHYGIRATRRIRLDRTQPLMRVETIYEKVSAPPRRVGVWIVTQLKHPVRVVAPIPPEGMPAPGYNRQSADLPSGLERVDNLLSLTRDAARATKIGTASSSLLWMDERIMLRIDSPRIAGLDYPDQGSSAEIYTNPDPSAYVELEMLGPLQTLQPGEILAQTNTYTLLRRTHPNPDQDARRVFGLFR